MIIKQALSFSLLNTLWSKCTISTCILWFLANWILQKMARKEHQLLKLEKKSFLNIQKFIQRPQGPCDVFFSKSIDDFQVINHPSVCPYVPCWVAQKITLNDWAFFPLSFEHKGEEFAASYTIHSSSPDYKRAKDTPTPNVEVGTICGHMTTWTALEFMPNEALTLQLNFEK